MNFEVTGIGYPNKGAELMLRAVGEALKQQYGEETIIASIPANGTDLGYHSVGMNGYYLRFSWVLEGRDFGPLMSRFIPKNLLRSYGCVAQHEIDCVLDASGLRYSDKWGAGTLKRSIRDYQRVKKHGAKLVILPQAFGPFQDPEVRSLLPQLIDLADLVYARDPISLAMLTAAVGEQDKISLAPDFTALVSGVRPEDCHEFEGKVCVVPNARMLDMTADGVGDHYLDLLSHVVRRVHEAGLEAFVLNHEGAGDAAICQDFANRFEPPLPYAGVREARVVKGIIGSAAGLVTSRFHGLVSGLCQGVPSLSTSWNHKYEELCKTYNTPLSIIDPAKALELNDERVGLWLAHLNDSESVHAQALKCRASEQKAHIRDMWSEVFDHVS